MWFWWDKFFSNSFEVLSHYVSINFLFWTLFLFFYFKLLYISTRFLCSLTCLRLLQSWIFCYLSSCCFLVSVFVIFWMLLMVVRVNIATFSIQKILITFVILLLCPLNYVIVVFSKAHGKPCFHRRNFIVVLVFVA